MGRHSSGRYTKGSRIKIIVMLLILLIIIAIISVYVYNKNIEINSIKDTINNTFSALKKNDKNQVNKYLEYDKLLSSLDEMLVKEDVRNEEVEKKLFESIEWNIENIQVNGENATVVVELSNKDFIKIVTSWMKKIVNERNNGAELTDELSLQRLQETLEETNASKTVIKKISLYKEENWKIKVNEEFTNLVFPGVDSVVNVLNQT